VASEAEHWGHELINLRSEAERSVATAVVDFGLFVRVHDLVDDPEWDWETEIQVRRKQIDATKKWQL
jgi:hypothetical protein